MNIFEEEIVSSIVIGNLKTASSKSKEWLNNIPINIADSKEGLLAKEAYLLSKYYFHRLERLNSFYHDKLKERAYFYLEIIEGIYQLRKKENLEILGNTNVFQSIYYQIHTEIAKNFSLSFSNQEFYSLDPNEILLLSKSLLIIENWSLTQTILHYILNAYEKNALAYYYYSYVLYKKGESRESKIHLKNCLFWNPSIIKNQWEFMSLKDYSIYWEKANTISQEEQVQYLHFALLLEINILYEYQSDIIEKNFHDIYNSFTKSYNNYLEESKQNNLRIETKIKILYLLCILIQYYINWEDAENTEKFCGIMNHVEQQYFQIYFENYISKKVNS